MADAMKGLLDKLGKSANSSAKDKSQAENAEDAWVAKFEDLKRKVIRPTFEALGQEVRKQEHDFNIIEFPFKRLDTRPMPQESSIRMDIYLSNERTKTVINAEKRPSLKFETHHRSQMVQVTICDVTSRGGVESKIGDFPVDRIDAGFIKEKFVALFKRLLAAQPGGARGR
jgi:hypothetical protein